MKSNITIKQAQEKDIHIIESILQETETWLREINQPLWGIGNLTWNNLSKHYQVEDFYLAFLNREPAGCVAIIDYDPIFWGNIPKGESLYIHKLAVRKFAKKKGVSHALMDFFIDKGRMEGVKSLRLDTHALRPKLRAFYEHHGFVCVNEKVLSGKYHTAFYIYKLNIETNEKN